MKDDIRPRGTVEVKCSRCGWDFWIDALDSRLPDGPFVCSPCDGVSSATLTDKQLDDAFQHAEQVLRAGLDHRAGIAPVIPLHRGDPRCIKCGGTGSVASPDIVGLLPCWCGKGAQS